MVFKKAEKKPYKSSYSLPKMVSGNLENLVMFDLSRASNSQAWLKEFYKIVF